MISIKIISTPAVLAKLKERGAAIIEPLVATMNKLMFKLQTKVITEKIPTMFKTQGVMAAAMKSSIASKGATVEGNKILGIVTGGGTPAVRHTTLRSGVTYDIAVLQEQGVAHGWEILPFNKKALSFMLDVRSTIEPGFGGGGNIVVKRVQHPGIAPHPFMREALHDMEAQITSELKEAFLGTLNA